MVPVGRTASRELLSDIHVLCISLAEDNPTVESKLMMSCRLFDDNGTNAISLYGRQNEAASTDGELMSKLNFLRGNNEMLHETVQRLCTAIEEERATRCSQMEQLKQECNASIGKLSQQHDAAIAQLNEQVKKYAQLSLILC